MPKTMYGLDPYSAEAEEIERRRMYADALQKQALQPIQPATSGGITAPISWTQGLAKMLEGYNAGAGRRQAEEEKKTLSERYQRDLANTLRRGTEAQVGTPARVDEDASGNVTNTPAMAGDSARAAEIFMGHPATLPMGMQAMQRDMAMRAAGLTPGGGAAPQQPAAGGMPGFGAIPQSIQAKLLSTDPGIKALGQAEVKAWLEHAKTQTSSPRDLAEMAAIEHRLGLDRLRARDEGLPVDQLPPYRAPGAPLGAPGVAPAPTQPPAAAPVQGAPIVQAQGGKFLQPTEAVPPEDYPAFIRAAQGGSAPAATPAVPTVPGMSPKGAREAADAAARKLAEEQAKTKAEREAAQPSEEVKLQSTRRKAAIVSERIDAALGQAGFFSTGLTGKVASFIPGTNAYDLGKTVDTIKANIGFQELQSMREASPTGGALGQVAVRELDFLQAAIASLDQGQSPAQLRDNLMAVKRHFDGWKNAVEKSYEQKYGTPPAAPADQPLSEAETRELEELRRRLRGR